MTPVSNPPMITSSRNAGLSAMLAKGAMKTAARKSMGQPPDTLQFPLPSGEREGPVAKRWEGEGIRLDRRRALTPALSPWGRGGSERVGEPRSPMAHPEIGVDHGLVAAYHIGRAVGDLAAVVEDDD